MCRAWPVNTQQMHLRGNGCSCHRKQKQLTGSPSVHHRGPSPQTRTEAKHPEMSIAWVFKPQQPLLRSRNPFLEGKQCAPCWYRHSLKELNKTQSEVLATSLLLTVGCNNSSSFSKKDWQSCAMSKFIYVFMSILIFCYKTNTSHFGLSQFILHQNWSELKSPWVLEDQMIYKNPKPWIFGVCTKNMVFQYFPTLDIFSLHSFLGKRCYLQLKS